MCRVHHGRVATLSHDEHKRVVEIRPRGARGGSIHRGHRVQCHAEAMTSRVTPRGAVSTGRWWSIVLQQPTQEGLYATSARSRGRGHPHPRLQLAGRTPSMSRPRPRRLVKDCPISWASRSLGIARPDDPGHPARADRTSACSRRRPIHSAPRCPSAAEVISVVANIVPRETAEMTHAALAGTGSSRATRSSQALPAFARHVPRDQPHSVKEAMGMMGMPRARVQGCPCVPWAGQRERLKTILVQHGSSRAEPRDGDVVIAGAAGRMGWSSRCPRAGKRRTCVWWPPSRRQVTRRF